MNIPAPSPGSCLYEDRFAGKRGSRLNQVNRHLETTTSVSSDLLPLRCNGRFALDLSMNKMRPEILLGRFGSRPYGQLPARYAGRRMTGAARVAALRGARHLRPDGVISREISRAPLNTQFLAPF